MQISVIIPLRNSRRHLTDCIESIICQTFSDFELLLIDDGSIDGSSELCDSYAKSDPRIRVFHIPGRGVSNARNYGIQKSRAPYITFIDSDDWIDSTSLNLMYNKILESNCDLLILGYQCVFDDGGITIHNCQQFDAYSKKESAQFLPLLIENDLFNSSCNKLYKSCIIKELNVCFPENISSHEDCFFNLEYFRHINSISCIASACYHYRIHSYTSLSRTYLKEMSNIHKTIYEEMLSLFKQYEISNEYCIEYRYFLGLSYSISICLNSIASQKDKRKLFFETISNTLYQKYLQCHRYDGPYLFVLSLKSYYLTWFYLRFRQIKLKTRCLNLDCSKKVV